MSNRREFFKLAVVGGGVLYALGLAGCVTAMPKMSDFYFVQLSDSHWGYAGEAHPDAANTYKNAVASVNALFVPPDFIMFTDDLTHTTDDTKERRRRLADFKEIVSGLKVQQVRFMPGEHDASLDNGAYRATFSQIADFFIACSRQPGQAYPAGVGSCHTDERFGLSRGRGQSRRCAIQDLGVCGGVQLAAQSRQRRAWLKRAAIWSAAPLAGLLGASARSSDEPARVVKITAQKSK